VTIVCNGGFNESTNRKLAGFAYRRACYPQTTGRACLARLPGGDSVNASTTKLPLVAQASSPGSRIALSLLVIFCCLAFGCYTGSKPKVETPPAAIAQTEDSAPQVAK